VIFYVGEKKILDFLSRVDKKLIHPRFIHLDDINFVNANFPEQNLH